MSLQKLWVGVIVVCTLTMTAGADLIVTNVGDPAPSNSWTQNWTVTSGSGFDFVGFRMISSGDSFKTPFASNFDPSDWGVVASNAPTYATVFAIAGSAVTSVDFTHTYAGSMWNSLTWELAAYNGDDYIGSAKLTWNGLWWSQRSSDWNPGREFFGAVVPLPAPVALAGVGLLGVIITRRRLRAA